MLKDSLLWEIQTNGISHSSFIFGTIHLSSPSLPLFLYNLERILNDVFVVYTETSLDKNIDPAHYLLPNNQTLCDYIGFKQYTRMANILKKAFGVNLDQFSRFLPLFTAQNIGLISQGMQSKPSLDAHIHQMAIRLGKEYKGLESMDEQLEILSKIPLDYQVRALLKISRNVRGFRKSFKKLVDMYEGQKISALYQSSKKQLGPIRHMLLYDRNRLMADRIVEHHLDRSSLFTFGAGHLAGDKGVLPLLKRRGFAVKALPVLPVDY